MAELPFELLGQNGGLRMMLYDVVGSPFFAVERAVLLRGLDKYEVYSRTAAGFIGRAT